jgi:hypothetical protein
MNVKAAYFSLIFFGVVKRYLKMFNGFLIVIIVSVISNICIVGGSKHNSKISKVSNK